MWPSVAAVALVHNVRHWQTAAVCSMLRDVASSQDAVGLIGLLLRVGGVGKVGGRDALVTVVVVIVVGWRR